MNFSKSYNWVLLRVNADFVKVIKTKADRTVGDTDDEWMLIRTADSGRLKISDGSVVYGRKDRSHRSVWDRAVADWVLCGGHSGGE